ncbi:MAG: cytochrome c oxidase subunit 3 [Bryobacteraceae bacterium]
MSGLLSNRVSSTEQVVVMDAALDQPKPPTGLYLMGMAGTGLAIFAFFAALVVAFVWRSQTRDYWTPVELPSLLWVSSGVILISSVAAEFARRYLRRGLKTLYRRWLGITAVLGIAFLTLQVASWKQLADEGAFVVENPHASFYYIFTGLHGGHLVLGLSALLLFTWRAWRTDGPIKRREWIASTIYYWHFMGALWIGLFVVLLEVH